MTTKRMSLLLLAGILLVTSLPALAQTTGNIRGQVRDPDGAPLPGVTITVTNVNRGNTRTAVTGESGNFSFPALAVDTYELNAQLEGFQEQVVEGVRVGISANVTIDMTLELATIEDTITVSGTPVLETTSTAVGTSFSAEFLEQMPTNRNYWDMFALTPGVSQQSEQSTSMSVFGSSIASNSYSVDGLDVTNSETGEFYSYLNPDTIEEIQVLALGAPAQYGNMSGAAFNVVTKSGTNTFRGRASLYYQSDNLTDTNAEINGIPFNRDTFHDLSLTLGGPIKRDKVWFFASFQDYESRESDPGVDPNFPGFYDNNRYDLKLDAQLGNSTLLDAKYHHEDWESGGGDAFSTPDATGINSGPNPAWGIGLSSVLGTKNLLEVRYSGDGGDWTLESLTGSTADPYFDRAPPGGGPWLYSEGYLYPYIWDTSKNQVDATLSTHADDFLKGDHEFKFGVQYGVGEGDTTTASGPRAVYYYRNEYVYDYYGYEYTYEYYYRVTSRAYHYGADTTTISGFIDDSWRLTESLTLNLGLRYDSINADIPDFPLLDGNWNETGETIPGLKDAVDWTHFSPRLGFAYSFRDVAVLRGFYGKFYDANVTGNWYAPPPGAPSYFYEFSSSRNGPWTPYYVFDWFDNPIDPNMKPPETDQFTLGYEHRIGSAWTLGIQGVYKETKNLIGWEILDDGVYEMVPWTNPFTGEVQELASVIEQPTTVKSNRPGAGSLAPPGQVYEQDFKGVVLTFNKRYSNGWTLYGSYTYSNSTGYLPKPWSEVQGDPFYAAFPPDPNNFLNAEQALQNERRNVVQVQSTMDLPWKLSGTANFRYLDGKPYNRQMSVGGLGSQTPLNQGSVTVIAIPATSDVTRPSQTVFDFSLARPFTLGPTVLTVRLDLLNAFNEDSFDWWETLNVPPGDEYVPSGFIWPRRLMINLAVDF